MNLSREYAPFADDPTIGSRMPSQDAALPSVAETRSAEADGAADAAGHGTGKIVNLLVHVLREEAAMLDRGDGRVDGSLTRQKLQLMMQLNRIDPGRENLSEQTRSMLAEAKRLLDSNARVLKRRMTAIQEIAAMISQEINEAQSDGTYDVSVASRGHFSA